MAKKIAVELVELINLVNGETATKEKYKLYIESLKRKCGLCGKPFIPDGRPDTKYCDTCQEAGGVKLAYKKKISENDCLKLYAREYQRRYAHIRNLKGKERQEKMSELKLWVKNQKATEQKRERVEDKLVNIIQTFEKRPIPQEKPKQQREFKTFFKK
jgi:hypothetical protein